MNNKNIISNNKLTDTLNDLKLFEQSNYCLNFIKNIFEGADESEILKHAEISSACFRQSFEYLKASKNVSTNASPLLLSYAFNNLLKGICYLKSFDDDILKGFNDHGFAVKNDNLQSSLSESKINIKKHGALISLLQLFGNSIDAQEIEFYRLLRHMPGIENMYFKTSGFTSLVAQEEKNNNDEYIIVGNNISNDTRDILKDFGLVCQINSRDSRCYCYTNMTFKKNLQNGLYSKADIFFRDYLIAPEKFKDGIKSVNISFYSYLLIMAYGMIVRYNANKWEEYVDKRNSEESTLIELSIDVAIETFYEQMHYFLFDYYYVENSYNDMNVKKVINNSTADIMNNITKMIEEENFRYNTKYDLPWHKNYR